MIKKLVGSVIDVLKAQKSQTTDIIYDFEKNRGYETNKKTIGVDIPRTSLVDFSGKTGFSDFSNQCQNEDVYHQHYLQGTFDGGLALDLYDVYYVNKVKDLYQEADDSTEPLVKTLKEEQANDLMISWTQNKTSLRFAYRDDDGKLCSFGVVYNKDFPDKWVLQIDKNINSPLDQRKRSLFYQGGLVESDSAIDVTSDNLSEEIKTALNSTMLNKLLSGLIDNEGKISLEKYKELNTRITSNKNIDNRDVKLQEVNYLLIFAENIPLTEENRQAIDQIQKQIKEDPDFFKEGNFEKNLADLSQIVTNTVSDSLKLTNNDYQKKLAPYVVELGLSACRLSDKNMSEKNQNKLISCVIKFGLLAGQLSENMSEQNQKEMLQNLNELRELIKDSPESDKKNMYELLENTFIKIGEQEYKSINDRYTLNREMRVKELEKDAGTFFDRHSNIVLFGMLALLATLISPPLILLTGIPALLAVAKAGYDEYQHQRKYSQAITTNETEANRDYQKECASYLDNFSKTSKELQKVFSVEIKSKTELKESLVQKQDKENSVENKNDDSVLLSEKWMNLNRKEEIIQKEKNTQKTNPTVTQTEENHDEDKGLGP